jgi:hypothetical protein
MSNAGTRARKSACQAAAATALGLVMLAMPVPASALPLLQLDILGGRYDAVTETIVAQDDVFTLYAYQTPKKGAPLDQSDHFISAAVVPKTGPAHESLGSFVFDGHTVNVTEEMFYGNPPIDVIEARDRGDLPRHAIFPSYFSEFPFQFSPLNRAQAYNTQDAPGSGPTPDPSGRMYWAAFAVDVSGLADGYDLHFDLYSTFFRNQLTCTGSGQSLSCTAGDVIDIDVDSFAPFSHDAQTGSRVPEPSSLILVGIAALAAGVVARRSRRA